MTIWSTIITIGAVTMDLGLLWTGIQAYKATAEADIKYWMSALQYFGWTSGALCALSNMRFVGGDENVRFILVMNFFATWIIAFLFWRCGNQHLKKTNKPIPD